MASLWASDMAIEQRSDLAGQPAAGEPGAAPPDVVTAPVAGISRGEQASQLRDHDRRSHLVMDVAVIAHGSMGGKSPEEALAAR